MLEKFQNFIENLQSYKYKIDNNRTLAEGEEKRIINEDVGKIIEICKTHTKIFKIEDNISKLLTLTKNEPKQKYFLPFDSIFVDCYVELSEEEYINGFLINKVHQYVTSEKKIYHNVELFGFVEKKDSNKIAFFNHPLTNKNIAEKKWFVKSFKELEKTHQNTTLFAINFLDFLNNPEVELVTVERTKEANTKRIMRGKIPIPPLNYVKVTGKLKLYVDKLNSNGHMSYNHRFWVRGHFRTLRNEERYGNKVGTRTWILPYIKGEGILINKQYEVKPNSSHN